MLGLLLALSCAAKPDFQVDLFLVANNPAQFESLDWVDKGTPETPLQSLLAPELTKIVQRKQPFILIDGGTSSQPQSVTSATMLMRNYESHDSATQTVESNGVQKTEVLERRFSTETWRSTFDVRPMSTHGGVSKHYIHFATPEKRQFVLIDLDSYKHCMNRGIPADKADLHRSVALSRESVRSTQEILAAEIPGFKGIVICAWGRPLAEAPNLVSLPPAGVVGHYKLTDTAGAVGIQFVKYIR